jgi:hypothetical protein
VKVHRGETKLLSWPRKSRHDWLIGCGISLIALPDAGLPALSGRLAWARAGLIALWFLSAPLASAAATAEVPPTAAGAPRSEVDIPTRIDIDAATRDMFPKGAFLLETATPHKPKSCDGLIDRVYWVNI